MPPRLLTLMKRVYTYSNFRVYNNSEEYLGASVSLISFYSQSNLPMKLLSVDLHAFELVGHTRVILLYITHVVLLSLEAVGLKKASFFYQS